MTHKAHFSSKHVSSKVNIPRSSFFKNFNGSLIFCCCSVTKSCPTHCNPVDCSTPGLPVLHYLLEFAQVHVLELMMLLHHLILCHPLLLLPSIFSRIRAFFQWVGSSHQMARVLELQLQHQSPSCDLSGLICFRIDSFDSLAVQGTLKSLLQHHNSNESIIWHSTFFIVQLSLWYRITGKTISLFLCRQSDVFTF